MLRAFNIEEEASECFKDTVFERAPDDKPPTEKQLDEMFLKYWRKNQDQLIAVACDALYEQIETDIRNAEADNAEDWLA